MKLKSFFSPGSPSSLSPGSPPSLSRKLRVKAKIDRCVLSPDSSRLAVYDNSSQLMTFYDSRSGRELFRGEGGFAFCLFHPSSRFLAYEDRASGCIVFVDSEGEVTGHLQPLQRASSLYACHRPALFTPDGRMMALTVTIRITLMP